MSVTAVANTTGTVQERYGYNGFGQHLFMSSTFGSISSSNYTWETLFDAYRWDSESGFYQVRYRYLHPTLGRWLTRDPLGEPGFEFGSQRWPNRDLLWEKGFMTFGFPGSHLITELELRANTFEMAKNNPIQKIDAFGLMVTNPPGKPHKPYCPPKRDCDKEENNCLIAMTLVCGAIYMVCEPCGVLCEAGALRACYNVKKDCEVDNKSNGYVTN
jgi:RHS repeat-associated protein